MKRLISSLIVGVAVLATSTALAQNPFLFTAESKTVEYCPICGGTDFFTVNLYIAEDPSNDGYPNDTQGFSLGIRYDAVQLNLAGAVISPFVIGQLGQSPDFLAINMTPAGGPGLTVGTVFSFFNTAFARFILAQPAVVATFELSGVLAGDFVGTSTPLTWSGSLGDPPVQNLVVVNGQAFDTDFMDGVILLVPEPGKEFIRGDVNGDGILNLVDPIRLAITLFAGGPMIGCEAAADANADVVLNLSDVVYLCNYLFAGGPVIPGPFPGCGIDQTGLECVTYNACP